MSDLEMFLSSSVTFLLVREAFKIYQEWKSISPIQERLNRETEMYNVVYKDIYRLERLVNFLEVEILRMQEQRKNDYEKKL